MSFFVCVCVFPGNQIKVCPKCIVKAGLLHNFSTDFYPDLQPVWVKDSFRKAEPVCRFWAVGVGLFHRKLWWAQSEYIKYVWHFKPILQHTLFSCIKRVRSRIFLFVSLLCLGQLDSLLVCDPQSASVWFPAFSRFRQKHLSNAYSKC